MTAIKSGRGSRQLSGGREDDFTSWSARNSDFIDRLMSYDFRPSDPSLPSHSFLADLKQTIERRRTLTRNQLHVAEAALEDYERKLARSTQMPSLDACPQAADPDVWELTLLFRREAQNQRITLAEFSNGLLYAKLERVALTFRDRYLSREGKPWTVDGISPASWQDLVRAAVTHRFAAYVEDAYAADRFTDPETFRQMIREVSQRGREWHLLRRHDEAKIQGLHDTAPPQRPPCLKHPKRVDLDGTERQARYLRENWLPFVRAQYADLAADEPFADMARRALLSPWQYEQVRDLLGDGE